MSLSLKSQLECLKQIRRSWKKGRITCFSQFYMKGSVTEEARWEIWTNLYSSEAGVLPSDMRFRKQCVQIKMVEGFYSSNLPSRHEI